MFRGISALTAVLATSLALTACGDDTPDTDGDLPASELASKLPDGGTAQAVAVDVDAAREASGLDPETDPTEISTDPEELRFGLSTFFALRDLAALTENPVRDALDHGLISAYAAHPYLSDEAITTVSSSQEFDEIASSLEDAGWERDGDVISTDGDPEQLTYTAVGAADGFIVLGYDPKVVDAVATGDAAPSRTGELQALEGLDAPVTAAVVPDVEGTECVDSITFEDFVDGTATMYVNVNGKADAGAVSKNLKKEAAGLGFDVPSVKADESTVTIELEQREDVLAAQLINSPAVLIAGTLDDEGPLLYDCG